MTCLAALIHGGKVFIGGDSAASVDAAVEVRLNRKVFRNGAYVIGTRHPEACRQGDGRASYGGGRQVIQNLV